MDWTDAPAVPGARQRTAVRGGLSGSTPKDFFDVLPQVLDEVPPLAGEESIYELVPSHPRLPPTAIPPFAEAASTRWPSRPSATLIAPLFEYSNEGVSVGHGWGTLRQRGQVRHRLRDPHVVRQGEHLRQPPRGVDRTSSPTSTSTASALDAATGLHRHLRRPAQLHLSDGFWSLTLYDEYHFFAPERPRTASRSAPRTRTSRPTTTGPSRSTSSTTHPGPATESNWLPAPADEFSLFLRAYWPEPSVLSGAWVPPPVVQVT